MTLPLVASYTSRLGFHIRAGTDKADYQDFIDMMSKLDGAAGLVLCTEATKPSTNLFPGMYIKCTDSGAHYYLDSTGSWASGVYSGGAWIADNYVTTVTLNGSQGNVIFGASNGSTPYIYGAIGGVSANAKIDIGGASITDLGVAAPVFTLTATTNVLIDVDVQLFKLSGTSSYTKANAKSVLSATEYNGNLQFDVYDSTSLLIGEFVTYLTQVGTTSVPYDGIMHLRGRKVVNLASGSHTLGLRVYNSAAFNGLSNNFTAPIFASITATVSG